MIKGPRNAVPTVKGWVSPKGEVLKCQKITQEQIDEWYAQNVVVKTVVQPEPEPVVEETVKLEDLMVEETPSVSLPKVPKASTLGKKIKNKLTGN